MRVLVASAPHRDTFGYSMPPPGLLRLGGRLRELGVDVSLEDLAHRLAAGRLPEGDGMIEAASELLLQRSASVIGLSTMGATLPAALGIARFISERAPGIPLLLGGPGVGGIEERLLERFPFVHAVVRGEGELTLPAVLERLDAERDLDGVPGVSWRRADGEVVREADRAQLPDLAAVSPYAWDLLPSLAEYKSVTGEREGLTPIDSGRGCAYDCSFCSIGRFWSRRSRTLPVERLVQEVLALEEIEGARNAYLCHDLFGADRAHAMDFCRTMQERGAPVPWECRARADHMDAELLQAMGRAGCYRVLLGVESADPEVRRRNSKNMADDIDLLAVVDDCARAGVTPILSLILGLPGEDDAGLGRSLDLCADAALRAGVNISLHLANPQPGCALGEEPSQDPRTLPGIPPDMAWGAGESAIEQALIEAHPDLFSTWHLLPLPEERLRSLAKMAGELPEWLHRYPRTVALLRRHLERDTAGVFSAINSSGLSLPGFVRVLRNPLMDETLLWEETQVRVASLADSDDLEQAGEDGSLVPRAVAVVLRTRHDLSKLTPALTEGGPEPTPGPECCFAVAPAPGSLGSVRTLRLGAGAATLLEHLDGQTNLDTLQSRQPALAAGARMLAANGLVQLVPLATMIHPQELT